jgi:hypothetical protein
MPLICLCLMKTSCKKKIILYLKDKKDNEILIIYNLAEERITRLNLENKLKFILCENKTNKQTKES